MNKDYLVVQPGEQDDQLISVDDRSRQKVTFITAGKGAFLNLPYGQRELDEEYSKLAELVEMPAKITGIHALAGNSVPNGIMMSQLLRYSVEKPLGGDVLVSYFDHLAAAGLKGNVEAFVQLSDGRIALVKLWGERQLATLLRFTRPVLYQDRRLLIEEFLLDQLSTNHNARVRNVQDLFDINAHSGFIMPRIDD